MLNSNSKQVFSSSRLINLARAMLVLVFSLLLAGCPKENPSGPRVGVSEIPREASPGMVPGAVAFNGERAMEHVKRQVEIGPRISGSTELAVTRDYIIKSLRDSGVTVKTDEFHAVTPIGEKRMVNITGEIEGESKDVIIVSSHYDSKYYKDMRFVGANDPGSSVATVLEMARVLGASQQKPKLTYWLVFFDGEEAFCEDWEQCTNPNPKNPKSPLPDNTYGSRQYVSRLIETNELGRVRSMILLDIMGYKNLELGRDTMSTRWLQDMVWRTGRELGYGRYFVDRAEGVGGDDHEPFLRAGIDALDIIQLSGYPYWHKADDTIDKVSAQSMKIVGDTVLASLPKIAERWAGSQSSPAAARSPE